MRSPGRGISLSSSVHLFDCHLKTDSLSARITRIVIHRKTLHAVQNLHNFLVCARPSCREVSIVIIFEQIPWPALFLFGVPPVQYIVIPAVVLVEIDAVVVVPVAGLVALVGNLKIQPVEGVAFLCLCALAGVAQAFTADSRFRLR